MSLEIKREALSVVRLAHEQRLLLKLSRETNISYHVLYNAAARKRNVMDAEDCQKILEHVTGLKLELR